jgi:hypothetical protein
MSVRTTVQIDKALLERIRRLTPRRGFSQFVNEALASRLDSLEREPSEAEHLEREMIEGYIATREDRELLNRDWSAMDGEAWPT